MVWNLVLVILMAFRQSAAEEDNRFEVPDELEPAPNNLFYAFVMFRHGIRTPIYPIPPDKVDDYKNTWPEGIAGLTDAGKRLMLHVGRSLRTRYQRQLPDFDEYKVVVTSTKSQRTAMSAGCVAAGMFPSSENVIDEIPSWQPVPVFQNTEYDKHALFDEKEESTRCLQYVMLRDSVRNDERAKEPITRRLFYKKLNKKLAGSYGMKNFVESLEGNFRIWDSFKMTKLNLKPIPDWAPTYMGSMERLAQIRMWRSMHAKETMLQFYSGPFFLQVVKEMMDHISNMDNDMKMHLHGTHDITLCSVFWTLSLREAYFPQVGDTIMLELYKDLTIKLFHYSPLEEKKEMRFQQISLLPLCARDPCPLGHFTRILKPLVLSEDQWKSKCSVIQQTRYRKEPQRDFPIRRAIKIWMHALCP